MRFPHLAWLGAVLVAASAPAATLVLGPARDNTLYESGTGALSNGSGPSLFAGNTAGGDLRRALLAFDLGSLPAHAELTRVTLTLTLTKTNSSSGTQTMALRRVLRSWGEGSSNAGTPGGTGATAAAGDATWLHAVASTVFWTNPGGDFADTLSARQQVSGPGSYTWESAQMLADVQRWIADPTANHGWVLTGDEAATGTAKRFASREATTASQRPRLSIEYTLPNTAPTAGSLPDLYLALGGSGATIDPAATPAAFADPDGDRLVYTVSSSDTTRVSAVLEDDVLRLTARAPGTATLTLAAEDGRGGAVSLVFAVQVNTPPTLAAIADQAIDEGEVAGPLGLEVDDAETAAANLTLSARAEDAALLPAGGVALAGSGSSRTLTLTPAPGHSGSTRLTLTLSDGTDSTSQSFLLTVRASPVALVGDFDGDLRVGFDDFFLFADHFGQRSTSPGWNPLFDLDGSGDIGFDDFFLFADHFGEQALP